MERHGDSPMWNRLVHVRDPRSATPVKSRLLALARHLQSVAPVQSVSDLIRVNLGRALLVAAMVGTVLVLINHGDHLDKEPVCQHFFAKCALSYVVPFAVSLFSAVVAARAKSNNQGIPGG